MMLLLAAACLLSAGLLLALALRQDRARARIDMRLEGIAVGLHGGAEDPFAEASPLRARLRRLAVPFERAGFAVTPRRAALGLLLASAVFVSLLSLAGPRVAVALFAAGLLLGAWLLGRLSRRRSERLLAALPELLESMRQAVMAGNAPAVAFVRALRSQRGEVRAELRSIERRLQLGASLPEAFAPCVERLQFHELRLLAILFRVHQVYGGSFNEMLESLIKTLRDRQRTAREFKAASSEIRMSTRVVQLVPLFVAFAIWLVQPEHFDFFFSEAGFGHGLAILGLYGSGLVISGWLARADY